MYATVLVKGGPLLLWNTVCKVQAGFCTSQKTYSWGRTVFLACSHLKDMCMMVVMGSHSVQGSSSFVHHRRHFLGPELGMLAPKRYVHDGCHLLVSLCSHHGHTLAHTVCKVQAGFCTSQKTYSWGRTVFLACSHLKDMCMMVVMGIALNLAS